MQRTVLRNTNSLFAKKIQYVSKLRERKLDKKEKGKMDFWKVISNIKTEVVMNKPVCLGLTISGLRGGLLISEEPIGLRPKLYSYMKNNDHLFKDTSKLKSKIKVWRNVKYDADEFQMPWKLLEKKRN